MFESRRGRRSTTAKRVVRTQPSPRREETEDSQASPTLRNVALGGRCRIVRLRARGPARQRLVDLGLVPSAVVTVVRRESFIEPLEIQLGDEMIPLRREDAAQIEIAFEA